MVDGIATNVLFAAHAELKTHLAKTTKSQEKSSIIRIQRQVGRLNIRIMHKETKYSISSFVFSVTGKFNIIAHCFNALNNLLFCRFLCLNPFCFNSQIVETWSVLS